MVRSEEAIGAILECPKCGSFVQVEAPEGWTPQEKQNPTKTAPEANNQQKPAAAGVAAAAGAAGAAAEPVADQLDAGQPDADQPDSRQPDSGQAAAGAETTPSKPPPLPTQTAAPGVAVTPVEMIWRKWLLTAVVPLAGVAILVGAWMTFFSGDPEPEPADQTTQTPVDVRPDAPAQGDSQPTKRPTRADTRWLPAETVLLVRCRPSQWADTPTAAKALLQYREPWQATAGRLIRGLGLKLDAVHRLTWAATDLSAWPERCVAIVELAPDHDATLLADGGEPAGFSLDGSACRKPTTPDWPHPFAAIDSQWIVTGDATLLRALADRSQPEPTGHTMERLLAAVSPDADATVLVDLTAARRAGWKLPSAWLDVWPAGKQPWHVLWEVPDGLGCAIRSGDRLSGRVALVCEGPTAVKEVKAAVNALLPAAKTTLDARLKSLPSRLQSGEITAAASAGYERLLGDGLAAARAARSEVVGETVIVDAPGTDQPAALAAAVLDRRDTIHADWLAAARTVDQDNQRRLITGLNGYAKAEKHYPPGVAGGALLAPETRLSWIATMLPYLDRADWQRQLEFGYPWNGPQNREITAQQLPEVVNPAVGPQQSEAGFPVTHYVGVAGVGPDAARLGPDDPRAGVFGFRHSVRPEEIADGASNTIAIAGVTGDAGPWAAGGRATVRAFTQKPYVNGPDGFGSGQPNGMLVTMADGSVRFISKDVAPEVIEQLATVSGGGDITVAALEMGPPIPARDPLPDSPKPEPEVPGPVVPEAAKPSADPVPPAVDIGQRLAMNVPEIELPPMELGRAVAMLSTISGVPISFDPQAMAELGVSLRDQVQLKMNSASIDQILRAVAAQRKLVPVVTDGQVLLSTSAEYRQRLYPLKYTVSDLTGNDMEEVAEMAALVQKMVAPETWQSAGGRGTLKATAGALQVTQTAPVHHALLVFCEKLRVARGRPIRSGRDPQQFRLESRRHQAQTVLKRTVTANFHQPTPLINVAGYLARMGEVDVLVDRVALGREGLSDQTPTTLVAHDKPLAAALDRLAESAGLAWRVIDPGTLQITSRGTLEAQPELEFYRVAALLRPGRSGPGLAESIATRVDPTSWSEAGGPGAICFDEPSGCLIVRQSQPAQAEIERLLDELGTQKPQP